MTSTGAGDITLNAGDTLLLDAAGDLELNSSAGAISIGNDAVSQNINIGTGGTRTISVGTSASSIAAAARLILTNALHNQAVQVVDPASSSSVTVNNTTSLVLFVLTGDRTNVTINFPTSVTDGHVLTLAAGSTNSITLINSLGGASIVNEVTTLDPTPLLGIDPTFSVTYYYRSATNTWYRISGTA